eukprot:115793-Prorocentrum_minimum.AAC.1
MFGYTFQANEATREPLRDGAAHIPASWHPPSCRLRWSGVQSSPNQCALLVRLCHIELVPAGDMRRYPKPSREPLCCDDQHFCDGSSRRNSRKCMVERCIHSGRGQLALDTH